MVLKLGQQVGGRRAWQEINGSDTFVSTRVLSANTSYYIILSFDGNEYSLRVSSDGEKYYYYIIVPSSVPLDIIGGNICLGLDRSTQDAQLPFGGEISLAPFTVNSDNIILTQWFETVPVEEENTFRLESELDIGVIGVDFFSKFAKFIERYVYPTLKAFKAKLTMKGKVTFLPYTRQRFTYIASNIMSSTEQFMVEESNNESHIPYEVDDAQESYQDFLVHQSSEEDD